MKKVIIIEDDSVIMRLYQRVMKRLACQVYYFQDGETGLSGIREMRPDFVLLDYELPDKSGLDVLKEIRQEEAFSEIPIIVVTAREREELRECFMEAGATEVFGKPFSPVLLSRCVGDLLELAQ